ncbi:MAG: hypothetical protein ACN6OB_05500 [Chryseobacterium jejuense]|uniref:hypothetical protein n=1 Tax=Chryseobacterium jejuense TaxID=445960 RepID=UPI003D0D49A9
MIYNSHPTLSKFIKYASDEITDGDSFKKHFDETLDQNEHITFRSIAFKYISDLVRSIIINERYSHPNLIENGVVQYTKTEQNYTFNFLFDDTEQKISLERKGSDLPEVNHYNFDKIEDLEALQIFNDLSVFPDGPNYKVETL